MSKLACGLRIDETLMDEYDESATFERITMRKARVQRSHDGKRVRKGRDQALKRQRSRKFAQQGR